MAAHHILSYARHVSGSSPHIILCTRCEWQLTIMVALIDSELLVLRHHACLRACGHSYPSLSIFFSLPCYCACLCFCLSLHLYLSSSLSLRVCDMRKTYTYNFFSDNPDIESGLGCRNYFQLFSPEHRG